MLHGLVESQLIQLGLSAPVGSPLVIADNTNQLANGPTPLPTVRVAEVTYPWLAVLFKTVHLWLWDAV